MKTVGACGCVRRDVYIRVALCIALDDFKILIMANFKTGAFNMRDVSKRRKLPPDVGQKGVHNRARTFHLSYHTFRPVLNKAAQIVFDGQTINKGPEANSLHNAGKKVTDSFFIYNTIF